MDEGACAGPIARSLFTVHVAPDDRDPTVPRFSWVRQSTLCHRVADRTRGFGQDPQADN